MKPGTFFGYLMLFVCIAVTVTVTLIVYSYVSHLESWRVALILFAVIIILSALCTLVDFLRRKFITERITDEISAATMLISKGNFDIRLTPRHSYKNYDEYDRIMLNINALAEELSKTEMLRNDFISNVSHEIKTPVSVISSYASALKKETDEVTRNKYTETLISACNRLSRLVMNILKLNKLENSSLKPDNQTFDLSETVRECILGFEEIIDKKSLELICNIEDEMQMCADKSLLETVINNLLSNAVKFTPEGGAVTVELKSSGGRAEISVKDTGCGMNAETGRHIFDKFYQGDTSHSSEGNGLGLAMVKRIIDLFGGEIDVESEEGRGTAFTVKLKQN